jgi:hypothetical protein
MAAKQNESENYRSLIHPDFNFYIGNQWLLLDETSVI